MGILDMYVRTLYIFRPAFLILSLRGVGDLATHIAFPTFQLDSPHSSIVS